MCCGNDTNLKEAQTVFRVGRGPNFAPHVCRKLPCCSGTSPGLQWQPAPERHFAAELLVEWQRCCLGLLHCEVPSVGLFSHWEVCFAASGGSDAPGEGEATGPSLDKWGWKVEKWNEEAPWIWLSLTKSTTHRWGLPLKVLGGWSASRWRKRIHNSIKKLKTVHADELVWMLEAKHAKLK